MSQREHFDKQPIITPFIINGLVLWARVDTPYYVERAEQYESFLMYSEDFVPYSPVKFERI